MIEIDATGNLMADAIYEKDFVRWTIIVNYKEQGQDKKYFVNCYKRVQEGYVNAWLERLKKGRETRVRGDVKMQVSTSGNLSITVFPTLVHCSRDSKAQGEVAGGGDPSPYAPVHEQPSPKMPDTEDKDLPF